MYSAIAHATIAGRRDRQRYSMFQETKSYPNANQKTHLTCRRPDFLREKSFFEVFAFQDLCPRAAFLRNPAHLQFLESHTLEAVKVQTDDVIG